MAKRVQPNKKTIAAILASYSGGARPMSLDDLNAVTAMARDALLRGEGVMFMAYDGSLKYVDPDTMRIEDA